MIADNHLLLSWLAIALIGAVLFVLGARRWQSEKDKRLKKDEDDLESVRLQFPNDEVSRRPDGVIHVSIKKEGK